MPPTTTWLIPMIMGGIMEVAMWLCASLLVGLWSSLGLVPIYVVWVLGNEGWGGGSSTYVRLSYTWLRNWFKDANGFDFEYSSNIQLRPKKTFLSLYLCLVQMMLWIYIFYIKHIAICMCNSLKCWFKHPLSYIALYHFFSFLSNLCPKGKHGSDGDSFV